MLETSPPPLMHFRLTILGCSSAIPAYGRNPSGQWVVHNQHSFLLDCGEATQLRLQQYRLSIRNLRAVLISHLHGDHVYGLPGLLSTLSINGRTKPLPLVGPPGLAAYLKHTFDHTHTTLKYPLDVRELDPGNPEIYTQPVYESDKLWVYPLPLQHRVPTLGFRFQEKPRRPKLKVQAALAAGAVKEEFHLLKQGVDVQRADGTLLRAADFLAPAEPALCYAYCTDTRYHPPLADYIRGADLVYHDATFRQEHAERAEETAHTTALQAARLALDAGIRHLLLGHFSARYKELEPHLEEARAVFPETYLAYDGLTVEVGQAPAPRPNFPTRAERAEA